jgi:hypothetical protein
MGEKMPAAKASIDPLIVLKMVAEMLILSPVPG